MLSPGGAIPAPALTMRRLTLLLAALVIQGCIAVEDFGGSWTKGTADPALEGNWKKIGLAGVAAASCPALSW